MRFIRQPQNSTLCGIACVAMIAEKSLTVVIQKAIDLFKWDPKTVKTNSRTSRNDILRLLAKYGFSQRNTFKNFSSWDNIEGLNLVAVRYNSKTGNWHWIVAKRNRTTLKLYDPQKIANRISRKKRCFEIAYFCVFFFTLSLYSTGCKSNNRRI